MNDYKKPEIEFSEIDGKDIIVTSLGTETTPKDDDDGIWEIV